MIKRSFVYFLFVISAAGIFAGGALALESSLTGAYLQYPAGARMAAMGGTGVSYSSTLCGFINPALLAVITKKDVGFGSGFLSLGRLEGFVTGQTHISPRAAVSLNLLYRGDPVMDDLYDIDENKAQSGSFTTATFKAAVGYLLTRHLSAGAAIGIFYQRLPTAIMSGGILEYSSVSSVGGIDLGLLYRISDKSAVGVAVSNMVVNMDWQVGSSSALQATALNSVPPDFVAGYSTVFSLAGRPLLLACDLHGALVSGDGSLLDRPEARINLGGQWRVSDVFWVRSGLGDIRLNGDLLGNTSAYWDGATPAICAGFGLNVAKFRRGMTINYALRTDKIWEGIDQQIDIGYAF
ncbi:MAG: hypothetical protein PHC61_01420 [Chitinivibrionales bacterium]|nr:hypothetical protein [Chitinivibrionales bacterium]